MNARKITWNELSEKDLTGSKLHWCGPLGLLCDSISKVIVQGTRDEENVLVQGSPQVLLCTTADPSTDGAVLSTPRSLDFAIANFGGGYIELPCEYDDLPDL